MPTLSWHLFPVSWPFLPSLLAMSLLCPPLRGWHFLGLCPWSSPLLTWYYPWGCPLCPQPTPLLPLQTQGRLHLMSHSRLRLSTVRRELVILSSSLNPGFPTQGLAPQSLASLPCSPSPQPIDYPVVQILPRKQDTLVKSNSRSPFLLSPPWSSSLIIISDDDLNPPTE